MSTKRALTAETMQLLTNYGLSLLVGLVGTVLLTRALGPEDRGMYAWIMTLFTLATTLSLLVPYNIGRKLGTHGPQATWPKLVGPLVLLNLAGSVLTLPVLAWALLQPLGHSHPGLLLMAWLGVPLAALSAVFSVFIHLRRNLTDTLATSLSVKSAVTLLIVLGWAWQVLTLPLGVALGSLFSAVLLTLVYYAWLRLPISTWGWKFQPLRGQAWVLAAGWAAGLATYLGPKVPILILPQHVPLTELGTFSLATTLLDITLLLPTAATSVLVSHFVRAGHHAQGQRQAMLALLALALAMAGAGYVLAPWVLPWVFGAAFAPAVGPFQLLLLALVLQAPLATLTGVVTAKGQSAAIVLPPALNVLITTLGTLWLAPEHGSLGAAWAIVAGYAAQLALLWPLARHKAA